MHERCSNPCDQLAAVSTRRLRATNSCFVKGFAPEQHHFVQALLREHASFDNRMMLSHFMVQLVELIAEFYDQHGFLMKDVSLCNVGLRSLQERTVLLLDLDRFGKKAHAGTRLRNFKRMYMIPAEVAKIALEDKSCHESWRYINWFGLGGFFDNMTELDTSMFRSYCHGIFSITEVIRNYLHVVFLGSWGKVVNAGERNSERGLFARRRREMES